MTARRIFALIIIMCALAAGAHILHTAGSGQEGDYARVLVMDMTIADGHVSTPSAEIRYGHPPVSGLRSGTLTGSLISADGRVVRTFSIWDPRIQLGDTVSDDGTGTISGFMTTQKSGTLHLILPYTGEEIRFRLNERTTGRKLAEANLSDAAAAFAETYPQDPAVVAAREGGGYRLPQNLWALEAGAGVVLFLALVIMSFTMVRKKRN